MFKSFKTNTGYIDFFWTNHKCVKSG